MNNILSFHPGACAAEQRAPSCGPKGWACQRGPVSLSHRLLGVLTALAVLVSGCSALSGSRMGMGMGAERAATVAVAPLSPAERAFMTRAAAKGMYEIEVSKLAADRAINPGVRAYAQKMVGHYSQANNELIALMSARGVAPPKGLAADRATKLHRLASLPPSAAFDHGYVRVVGVEEHRTGIALFERARRDTKDRELRDWIDRMLSVMRSQLLTAEALSATLAG
jgi:putative membrane protein